MNAIYFWTGTPFTLMDYLSVLSTAYNTTLETIYIFHDDTDLTLYPFWKALDDIDRVQKKPARPLLDVYFDRYLDRSANPIRKKRVLADFFRYGYLYDQGGVWFDFDTFQVQDVRPLVHRHDFLAAWQEPDSINIGLLAFSPGHPILQAVLTAMQQVLGRPEDEEVFRIGPPLFTRVIKFLDLEHTILPERTFYPVHYSTGQHVFSGRYDLSPDTYSIHLWGSLNRRYFRAKTLADFESVPSTYFDLARQLPNSRPFSSH